MASFSSVVIAGFFQIMLHVFFSAELSSGVCSTAPSLASWIFLVALLDAFLDLCMSPVRYMHLPYICQLIVETLVTVLLAEFGTLVIWCKVEKMSYELCKSLLLLTGMYSGLYYEWERWILGSLNILISFCIILLVGSATDRFKFLCKGSSMCREVNRKLTETGCKVFALVKRNKGVNLEKRRRADIFLVEPAINSTPRFNSSKDNRSRIPSRSRSRNRRYQDAIEM